MEHERFIISLLQLPKVGRKTAWKILQDQIEIPQSPIDLMHVVSESKLVGSITPEQAFHAWAEAERTLEKASQLCIQAIAITRDEFPAWVKTVNDPPLILYTKGNTECIQTPLGVAVIGTREPSDYGMRVAHRLGMRVAETGFVVVSGLAIGCDSQAHRGCLEVNGKTVAVLAHGLDRVYPKDSQPLAEKILEKDGCWVSEYAPGMRAQRSYFVERDRIQAALSSGVIVVETDVEGGTMHTVGFSEEQRRPLACLDHPPEHSHEIKARGNALLIAEKRARPLKEAEDFVSFMKDVRCTAQQWIDKSLPAINELLP